MRDRQKDENEPTVMPAFHNPEFMESSDARSIRILSEYVEPYARFRRLNVKNTVVFFGSARSHAASDTRTEESETAKRLTRYHEDAAELARRITQWSMATRRPSERFYICSGGGPGMMEAANRGAHDAGGRSVGLNISLPLEQDPNPYQSPELSFEFHYFFMRKFWFAYLAKALVVFPGGFGTMDEMFELLTIVQTEKSTKDMPIILYGSDYWKEVINFDALVKWGTIDASDLDLFRFCDSVDDAFTYLQTELSRMYPPTPKRR